MPCIHGPPRVRPGVVQGAPQALRGTPAEEATKESEVRVLARGRQLAAQRARALATALYQLGLLRIELRQVVLQQAHAGAPRAFAVLEPQQMFDAQLQRGAGRAQRPFGAARAERAGVGDTVVTRRLRHEMHLPARCDQTTHVFTVVIQRELLVPGPGGFDQPPAHQPGGGEHEAVVGELGGDPIGRRQVAPQGVGREARMLGAHEEATPPAGAQHARAATVIGAAQLLLDLARVQDIVGIQELHVGALRGPQRDIARRRGAAIGLGHDLHALAREAARDFQGVVGRAIVNDDDFLGWPGLREGGADAGVNPAFGVVGGNEDGNQGFHEAVNRRRAVARCRGEIRRSRAVSSRRERKPTVRLPRFLCRCYRSEGRRSHRLLHRRRAI
jgi:hypothetical protein